MGKRNRCAWAKSDLCIPYHDMEWGMPVHDDRLLFEHLVLDTMQAGLSWELMLKKRENFRRGIVRNKLKIRATISNAVAFLAIQQEIRSFDGYLWEFVEGEPVINRWRTMEEIPVTTPGAEALSRDLKRRGFKFVGPTTVYAYMQAVGMVNDHTIDCFRYGEILELTAAESNP
jgi:DNA-3-methyladenine glycosylase I